MDSPVEKSNSSRPRRSRPGISDVAVLAGVSVGTVSKALNGTGQLAPETRRRVIEAAASIGFRANMAARSLHSGRTYTVGVLTSRLVDRFTVPIVTGAEDVLGAGEMSMLFCQTRGDAIREQHYLRTLMDRGVDGILSISHSNDPRPPLTGELDRPIVYALGPSTGEDDVSVVPNDGGGAAQAIEHLVATGRRRLVVVAGLAHQVASQHRVEAAQRRAEELGAEIVLAPLFGHWGEEWGRDAGALIARREEVDGVFCASDQIARGVLDGLREAGVSVPDRVGVVGMDNWDILAVPAVPPLTSVDLGMAEIGAMSARLLLDLIDGRPVASGVHEVSGFLVPRRSTAIVA